MILVLEASTASAKAMVYCPENGVQREVTRPYKANSSDVATQDAGQVLQAVLETGRQAAAGFPIEAISLCSIWHSLLLCDRDGSPASPIYTWADVSASGITAEMMDDPAKVDFFYRTSGCMVHAMYPLYKLMLLNRQGVKLADKQVFCQGSYLFYQLTGQRKTSASIVSGASLLNIHEKRYATELFDDTGIREEQLPPLGELTETMPLTREAAGWLGVREGIPVTLPYPDGGLNQVGAGALQEGIMTLSVGTSGALRVVAEKPVLAENRATWCYVAPGAWLSGAATASATSCVDWLRGGLFKNAMTYGEMEQGIVFSPNLPYFMPYLNGERCPGWRDERRACFSRMDAGDDAHALYYAVLEGVLFNLWQCYHEIVKINGAPKLIRVSGGVCKSPFWLQMLADIWQREVATADIAQASMLGAAAVGLLVTGHMDSLHAFQPEDHMIQPNPEMGEFYQKRFEGWLGVYEQTTGL